MWIGRSFTAEENRRGGPFAVVMSHGLWQRRYGGDSSIIGSTIVMSGRPRTVVGVLPPGGEFPAPDIGLWAPLRLNHRHALDAQQPLPQLMASGARRER
jgi:hypothetical protein